MPPQLIQFIIHCETSVPFDAPERMFAAAASKGPVTVPGDKGGLTHVGITHTAWRQYLRRRSLPLATPLASMSYGQWCDVLGVLFWDRCNADSIRSTRVAAAIVDWVWHSGSGIIRHVQRLLDVRADGIIGPVTIAAINARDPVCLFTEIQERRIRYYRAIAPVGSANHRFLRGWINRVNRLTGHAWE